MSKEIKGIIEFDEEYQDELVDQLKVCYYCGEPFKECDTIIPGTGVIVGETDVVKYKNRFWHHDCVDDWYK